MSETVDVTIIGGGMITNDLILPSVYHLQRTGIVGEIYVCALNSTPLQFLKENQVKIRGNSNSQQMQLYFGTDVSDSYGKYGIKPMEKNTPPYMSIGKQYETEYLSYNDLKKINVIWERESLDDGKRKVS